MTAAAPARDGRSSSSGSRRSWTRRGRRPRPAGARRALASARRGRRRLQRGHAPGRRDSRDHARGAGRRRSRDRVRRRRRLVSVVGTSGTGFLQNDACWRELDELPPSEWSSPFYVASRGRPTGRACSRTRRAASLRTTSPSRSSCSGSTTARRRSSSSSIARPFGDVSAALREIAAFPEVLRPPFLLPVIAERGL